MFPRKSLTAVLLASLSTLEVTTNAQPVQTPPPPAVDRIASPANIRDPADGPTADIDFSTGGTLQQFIDTARAAFGGNLNVIVQAGAAVVPLPAIRLSGITAREAVQAAVAASEGQEHIRVELREAGATLVIVAISRYTSVKTPFPETQVFDLAPLVTEKQKLEDILAAVQVVFDMASAKPETKYHAETGMLIVRGQSEELREIEELLNRLANSAGRNRYEEGLIERLTETQRELSGVRTDLSLCNETNSFLRSQVELLQAGQAANPTPVTAPKPN